jgi:hypothetical protein
MYINCGLETIDIKLTLINNITFHLIKTEAYLENTKVKWK